MSFVQVKTLPAMAGHAKHPVNQALLAVERAHAHSVEPWRIVEERLRVDAETRYAALLLAPTRIMRKQVVVMIDWTRCGLVKSLAMPLYVSTLRRAQTQLRRSNEFYFLLHYPARYLDQLGFDAAMAMLRGTQESIPDESQEQWARVLEAHLVHGLDAEAIGTMMGVRSSEIRSLLRDAAFSFRRARVVPNPLNPFRFGGPRWGGFQVEWDDIAQDYLIVPADPPPADACRCVQELLAEVQWSQPTANFGLQPSFDHPLPSAQIDVWSQSDEDADGINLSDLFPDAMDDLI